MNALPYPDITPAQDAKIRELRLSGLTVVNRYMDGAVRMERRLNNGDTLFTFVRKDGTSNPVRVWEEVLEQIAQENARVQELAC